MHCTIWYHLYILKHEQHQWRSFKSNTCSFRASGKIVPAKPQLSSPTEYLLAFWGLSGSIGKNTESTCFQVVLVRKLIIVSSMFLLPYHLYPILPHVGFHHHQHQ